MMNFGVLIGKRSYELYYREVCICASENVITEYRNIWKKDTLRLRENKPIWDSPAWYSNNNKNINYNMWIYNRNIGYLGINGEYRNCKRLNKLWVKDWLKLDDGISENK